ncbi:MAG: type ISP restriction/modification enzyme, partial [Rhodanobacteraceae bacterium]
VYRTPEIFGDGTQTNLCIVFSDPTAMKPWLACSVDRLPDLHYVGAAAGAVCVPLQSIGPDGFEDNVTDWALKQFQQHYGKAPPPQPSPSGLILTQSRTGWTRGDVSQRSSGCTSR